MNENKGNRRIIKAELLRHAIKKAKHIVTLVYCLHTYLQRVAAVKVWNQSRSVAFPFLAWTVTAVRV